MPTVFAAMSNAASPRSRRAREMYVDLPLYLMAEADAPGDMFTFSRFIL